MSHSPREVAEQVRRMVAGEGVLTYPFGLPGQPAELQGREAIRGYFRDLSRARDLLVMEGVEALVRETDDPEVVVTEITHHGWSKAAGEPYRHTALGVIRVRDGEIVHYDDYMNPIAVARLLGQTSELAAALSQAYDTPAAPSRPYSKAPTRMVSQWRKRLLRLRAPPLR